MFPASEQRDCFTPCSWFLALVCEAIFEFELPLFDTAELHLDMCAV